MSAAAPATSSLPLDALSAALLPLGPWGALLSAAMRFGIPFVTALIGNAQKGTDPTPEEWKTLTDLINVPGEVLIPKRSS